MPTTTEKLSSEQTAGIGNGKLNSRRLGTSCDSAARDYVLSSLPSSSAGGIITLAEPEIGMK